MDRQQLIMTAIMRMFTSELRRDGDFSLASTMPCSIRGNASIRHRGIAKRTGCLMTSPIGKNVMVQLC